MAVIYANLERVSSRLSCYKAEPDSRYRGNSGFEVEEEDIFQRIRQYWADENIADDEKLRGFEMDLSGFDPRNTTFMELNKIALGLEALGIIDTTTGGVLTRAYVDFDSQGNQINKHKKVDVFAYFDEQLKGIKAYIADGHGFADETLVKLNTGITVMLALDARAQATRRDSLLDTIV